MSEMITVMPANSTARPLVSIDEAIESSTLAPACRFSRCRVTMNIDADTETDHRHHRGREVGHRHDVAAERHERWCHTQAEQRDADGQAHGKHRAERDDENDDHRDQPVDLAFGKL